MTETSKPKRRLWPWILAGIVFLPPLAAMLVLSVIFRLNAIPDSQRQPPAELLALMESPHPSAPHSPSTPAQPRTDYAHLPPEPGLNEMLAIRSAPEALAIFNKWHERLELHDSIFYPRNENDVLEGWKGGDPLLPGMADWLVSNQELVSDLERLAELGGVKQIQAGELMALWQQRRSSASEMSAWPLPNYLFWNNVSKVLAAESRRRREAGDPAGAAEALLAIQPLADSIREPYLISVLVALSMQTQGYAELNSWLAEAPPPPELARRLRAGLEPYEITLQDVRAVSTVEYLQARSFQISYLRTPTWELFKSGIGPPMRRNRSMDLFEALDLALFEPGPMAGAVYQSAARTALLKVQAPEILHAFDEHHKTVFEQLDQNIIHEFEYHALIQYSDRIPNHMECMVRTATNLARLRVCLAALDRTIAVEGAAPTPPRDPFADGPLRELDEPAGTVIYSLGPDRADQRAAIAYDPTNGTTSPGDIFLRLR